MALLDVAYRLEFVFVFDLIDVEDLEKSEQTADVEELAEIFVSGRRLKEDTQCAKLLIQASTEEVGDAQP